MPLIFTQRSYLLIKKAGFIAVLLIAAEVMTAQGSASSAYAEYTADVTANSSSVTEDEPDYDYCDSDIFPTVRDEGDFYYVTDSDGTVTITKYTGSEEQVTIPEKLGGDEVTDIGDWAFSDCTSVRSVIIPDSVTGIGAHAFYGCKELTVCGGSGSYAEQYARDNDIPFELPSEQPGSDGDKTSDDEKHKDKIGDLDGDGEITSNDALEILRESVGVTDLTPNVIRLADVDGDNELTSNDALMVLRRSE